MVWMTHRSWKYKARKACYLFTLLLALGCSYTALYDTQGRIKARCFTWGQAECTTKCEPIHIKDEYGKTIYYHTNNNCMRSESKGLSENGATAIVQSILGIPEAIVKAVWPF